MKHRVLFCGTNVPDKIEYRVPHISAAGNRFQNNVIANLRELSYDVENLSFVGVPLSQDIQAELMTCQENKKYRSVLKEGISSIFRFHKLLKQEINDVPIVMCYNIIYAWLLLPVICRRKGKKSCVILADYSGVESYQNITRKLYAKLQLWSLRKFDLVVGLSSNIQGMLKKEQQFILMEGGIDQSLYEFFAKPKARNSEMPTVLMYSGLLSKVTGVDLLLEAFSKIDNETLRLVITGKGDLEEEVKSMALLDQRIEYKGHLTYEDYLLELYNADILVNPRNMNLPENQNNFPSKIMDYLATGKIVVSTKFAGWEIFKEYITVCESNVENLGQSIQKAVDDFTHVQETVYEKNRDFSRKFEWHNQLSRIMKELTGVLK